MAKPKPDPEPRPKPERPPPPPPSKWRVSLAGDAQPLEVIATTAVISTGGMLVFKGGPDSRLLKAFAADEWRMSNWSTIRSATHGRARIPTTAKEINDD